MTETFKDIPGYEGLYQVSDLGIVRSLDKVVRNNKGYRFIKGEIRKNTLSPIGYYVITLSKKSRQKSFLVHKLVAMAFLNHAPCGLIVTVDHINMNKLDNRVINLRLVSIRENCSFKRGKSKYTGVAFGRGKWQATIRINGKRKYLGLYNTEEEASKAYQEALQRFENGLEVLSYRATYKSSKYKGVSFHKAANKWVAQRRAKGKYIYLGSYATEEDAAEAYQRALRELIEVVVPNTNSDLLG